jgi:hypothetical protein
MLGEPPNLATAGEPDVTAATNRLRALAQALLSRRPDVLAVILGGPFAQVQDPGKSANLLVLLEKDGRQMVDRIAEFRAAFRHSPIAVDLLPVTIEEVRARRARHDLFLTQVIAEGVVLAARESHVPL